ncbi:unnamed protein product, partial [Gulo gulo]
ESGWGTRAGASANHRTGFPSPYLPPGRGLLPRSQKPPSRRGGAAAAGPQPGPPTVEVESDYCVSFEAKHRKMPTPRGRRLLVQHCLEMGTLQELPYGSFIYS